MTCHQVEDGKVDIRDRELQRHLSLTTADLRFGEFLVNAVAEDRLGTYDGTGLYREISFKLNLFSSMNLPLVKVNSVIKICVMLLTIWIDLVEAY